MKKAIPLLLVTSLSAFSAAQFIGKITPEAERYRAYRLYSTVPSFGLAKVKAAIAKLDSQRMEGRIMPAKRFNQFSTPEKFTYCMIFGEYFSQNCMGMPWLSEEWNKIFARPPGLFADQAAWSEKQSQFLSSHRAEVIGLIRSTIGEQKRVGTNLKAAIVMLNAKELIPDLVKTYEIDRKDQDILTVLMLLMKQGKDPAFLASDSYQKLYGPKSAWGSFLVATEVKKKQTTEQALAFYQRTVR